MDSYHIYQRVVLFNQFYVGWFSRKFYLKTFKWGQKYVERTWDGYYL